MEQPKIIYSQIRAWVCSSTSPDRSYLEKAPELICDALWLIGTDWDLLTSDQQNSYVGAVKTMIGWRLISEHECLTQLDERPLSACELIESQSLFTKRVRRIRTKLVYMQQKYNLIREENEGYSRLLRIVTSDRPSKFELVQKTAGTFDLDPHRVVDIVLDVLELDQTDDDLFQIVGLVKGASLAQLIGFKLQQIKVMTQGTAAVIGRLIKQGQVTLEQLWPHLSPESTLPAYEARVKLAQDIRAACNIVSLSGEPTQEFAAEKVRRSELDNHKLWVLYGLVKVNAWHTATKLIQAMPIYVRVHPPLVKALCEYMEWLIDPVYSQASPRHVFKTQSCLQYPAGDKVQAAALPEALDCINEVLQVLGLAVSDSPLLYIKVCRLLGLMSDLKPAYELIKNFLLPSLNSRCMFLANDLWKVIKEIPVATRYDFYAVWQTFDSDPYTLALQSTAVKETRAWIKRLSNENSRKEGRTLSKLVFNNPPLVYEEVLFQVMNYFNFASAVVTSLHNMSPLALDILPYSLISFMKSRTVPKLDDELGGVASWMTNLAAFTGIFFNKEHNVELQSLLEYIAECMSRGEIVEICIFKEILNKMTGWDPPDSLTEKMVASLGGASKLKLEIMNLLEMKRSSKRSAAALLRCLVKPMHISDLNTAVELAVLIGVNAERFVMTADTEHLKILGTLYDKLVDAFFLIIDILTLHYDTAESYASGIKHVQLSTLVLEHKLPSQLAVSLCRRALEKLTFEEVCDEFRSIYPECGVSLEFYTLFWMLGLQDVHRLASIYESEHQRLEQELAAKRKAVDRSSKASKTKKELSRFQQSIDDLTAESIEVARKYEESSVLIQQRAASFLVSSQANELINGLTQHCFYPRIMISMTESLYCAKFIELMQRLKIEGFHTMDLVYELITTIIPCVYCCTEREAGNIGLFFLTLFKTLGKWKDNFDSECLHSPGFEPSYSLKHFEEKLRFFHGRMAVTLGKCFSSTSYMQQRNALIVLTKLVPVFPTTNSMATQIMKSLSRLKESELDDLKLMASRYSDDLLVKFKPVAAPAAVVPEEPPTKRRRSRSPSERHKRKRYDDRYRSKHN